MKKLSLVVLVLGSMLLAACSKSGGSTTPVVANCATNGVYNPYGQAYPNGSAYPYGVPGQTGCAGIPYGQQGAYGQPGYGQTYGYGTQGNPCAVYNNGYQTWSVGYYGGQPVCVSNF